MSRKWKIIQERKGGHDKHIYLLMCGLDCWQIDHICCWKSCQAKWILMQWFKTKKLKKKKKQWCSGAHPCPFSFGRCFYYHIHITSILLLGCCWNLRILGDCPVGIVLLFYLFIFIFNNLIPEQGDLIKYFC